MAAYSFPKRAYLIIYSMLGSTFQYSTSAKLSHPCFTTSLGCTGLQQRTTRTNRNPHSTRCLLPFSRTTTSHYYKLQQQWLHNPSILCIPSTARRKWTADKSHRHAIATETSFLWLERSQESHHPSENCRTICFESNHVESTSCISARKAARRDRVNI